MNDHPETRWASARAGSLGYWAMIGACCLAVIGCGGPQSVEVAGDVTFNGKPVPAGKIYFNADVTKGNDGPQGFAEIHDGKFDTRLKGGRGARGGPTIAIIKGCEAGKDPASGMLGPHLFRDYEIALDLPKENSTQEFTVPVSAAQDMPKTANPSRRP